MLTVIVLKLKRRQKSIESLTKKSIELIESLTKRPDYLDKVSLHLAFQSLIFVVACSLRIKLK